MAKSNEIKYLTAIKSDKRVKKYCRFKKYHIRYIDYKDVDFLKKFLNEQGKLLPRRLTGNSLKYQRKVSDAVKNFSNQNGVTAFMTMLAAFEALLSCYSGEQHIVLGTDIANRTTAETERLIGFFINLLPLHTDLSGDPTFAELVLRVREVALGAYAHQDIPFDKLVEDLQPERSLSHNPIVQALFVMQNVPAQRRDLPGLELIPFPASISRSKFDVAVFIRANASGTFQDWLYSTELFDKSTILRMASNYEHLLRNAVDHPESRLSTLEFQSANEKQQLEYEKTQRKQSQRSKLMSASPKAVNLAETDQKQ